MPVEGHVFERVKSLGSHRTIENIDLVRCHFRSAHLGQGDDPEMRLVVRDVTLTDCVATGRSSLRGARVEEVVVDGLSTEPEVWLGGCVFRHVTLRGRIGSMMFQPPPAAMAGELRAAFLDNIGRYYQDVDWAVDISAAEFTDDVNFFFVPGDLVRRDAETQFLLRRETLAGVNLESFPVTARIEAQRFEVTPFDSIVAIAPKRSADFALVRAELAELRKAGLAE